MELSADSFAAVALVKSEGKDFALKVVHGMADQFHRIGSALDLQNIERSPEFFHRAVNMDTVSKEVSAENPMNFFGFGSVNQWQKHPTYFAISSIKITLALIFLLVANIWCEPNSSSLGTSLPDKNRFHMIT